MARNMSFMLTKEQIKNKTKTVTRRLGWAFLKAGDVVNACVKCQGLKKGERIEKICQIRIIRSSWSPLNWITQTDVAREGFPSMSPDDFVTMFTREMACTPETHVNRIEFEYM